MMPVMWSLGGTIGYAPFHFCHNTFSLAVTVRSLAEFSQSRTTAGRVFSPMTSGSSTPTSFHARPQRYSRCLCSLSPCFS